MKRIDTTNRAVDLFGAGKDGFKDGNPGTGDPATQLSAAMFNMLQEEPARFIEAAGLALDGTKFDQVLQAFRIMVRAGVSEYAADTGAANAYAIAPTQPLTAYTTGLRLRFKATNANTGAATLAVSGLAAKSITRRDGSALRAGDIPAGGMCNVEYDGTNFQLQAAPGGRDRLTANRTYYVRTNGNDANTGLLDTAGGAFLTLQGALDFVAGLDFNGFTVTVSIGDGTYNAGGVVKPWVGGGSLRIKSTTGTAGNQVITVANGHCIRVQSPITGLVEVDEIELRVTSTGNCILLSSSCHLQIGTNLRFGTCAGYHMMSEAPGGRFEAIGNYNIVGGAAGHIGIFATGAHARITQVTVTLSGTPAFSGGFAVVEAGEAEFVSTTFTGAATGARYNVSGNGFLKTNGASGSMPGNAAGATATGGQIS